MPKSLSFFTLFIVLFSFSGEVAFASRDDIYDHPYEVGIWTMKFDEVFHGYPDGTFRPDATINRAEFTKVIVLSQYPDALGSCDGSSLPFSDIQPDAWYSFFLCVAVDKGLIQGYPDNTFRPERPLSFVEAAKILTKVHTQDTLSSRENWYEPYVYFLQNNASIPPSIQSLSAYVTRGEVAEMLYRLQYGITVKASQTYNDLLYLTGLPADWRLYESEPYGYSIHYPPSIQSFVHHNDTTLQLGSLQIRALDPQHINASEEDVELLNLPVEQYALPILSYNTERRDVDVQNYRWLSIDNRPALSFDVTSNYKTLSVDSAIEKPTTFVLFSNGSTIFEARFPLGDIDAASVLQTFRFAYLDGKSIHMPLYLSLLMAPDTERRQCRFSEQCTLYRAQYLIPDYLDMMGYFISARVIETDADPADIFEHYTGKKFDTDNQYTINGVPVYFDTDKDGSFYYFHEGNVHTFIGAPNVVCPGPHAIGYVYAAGFAFAGETRTEESEVFSKRTCAALDEIARPYMRGR